MLRRSFIPPIPEYETAADLLSQAADALLAHDIKRCEALLRAADLRPLGDFADKIWGPIDPLIHRQTKNPIYDRNAEKVGPRMPSAAITRDVFSRDGYRCRFCGSRVIVKEARKVFTRAYPKAARWGGSNAAQHFGLNTLTASIDHIVPFARGGSHETSNLVTACAPCQYGRNQWTLEEVEIEDPRNYEPRVDTWDGLTRLVGMKQNA